MFVGGMEGTLMELKEASDTRYQYIVWFDYTRKAINEIQEGTLIAAPNFAGNDDTRHYSVLEVVTILPLHYALNGGSGGYPGFLVEAARSAAEDWETQETESTEETTKIRVVCIPTNLEIVESLAGESVVNAESNIAMVGCKVNILDAEYANIIANYGIDRDNEPNLTVIGTMARNDDVEILLRIEALYRTHFAIFGFTGVGKSNLLSTIVSKVLKDATEPLKLVFFDLMSEYTVLLLDQLLDRGVNGNILTIGRQTLPEGLFQYLNDVAGAPTLDEAARQFYRYSLMPKALMGQRERINGGLRDLVEEKKIRFFHEAQSLTVWDMFFTDGTDWGKTRKGPNLKKRLDIAKAVLRQVIKGADYKNTVFDPGLARSLRIGIEKALEANQFFAEDYEPILEKLRELERPPPKPFPAQ